MLSQLWLLVQARPTTTGICISPPTRPVTPHNKVLQELADMARQLDEASLILFMMLSVDQYQNSSYK